MRERVTLIVDELLKLTRDVVVSCEVRAEEAPELIRNVYKAWKDTAYKVNEPVGESDLKPAVPVKKSITDDYLVCLEDGKQFKSLKRHLRTQYGMTPDAYREKWGLPSDYPMVAPNYSKARSQLAKDLGLGLQRPQAIKKEF